MSENKNRKTKELIFDSEEVTKKPKKNNEDNSFYEKGNETKTNTKWTKDWRGKILGVSLVSLIILGAGIPAGMAITGYWHKSENENTIPDDNDSKFKDAQNILGIWGDTAIIDHYQSMVYEGYITQTKYDSDIKIAGNDAQETIDNQKNDLKDQYGSDSWRAEWDKKLQNMGFHTSSNNGEVEYKDSLISDKIITKELSYYTSYKEMTYLYNKGEETPKGEYNSSPNDDDEVLGIDISHQNEKDGISETSFTSQDLITLFLLAYEPIVYNRTRIPFTLVDADGGQTLNAISLTVTEDDMWAMLNTRKMIKKSGFIPVAEINVGVQSEHNLNLTSTETTQSQSIETLDGENDESTDTSTGVAGIDNVAVGLFQAYISRENDDTEIDGIENKSTNKSEWSESVTPDKVEEETRALVSLIETAFTAAIKIAEGSSIIDKDKGIDSLTTNDIARMSGDLSTMDALQNSLYQNLKNNLLSSESRTFVYNVNIDETQYAVYASNDGIRIVGKQFVGTELLLEQLNYDNKVLNDAVEGNEHYYDVNYLFFDSYTTWLTSNFENILLLDYMTESNGEDWFEYYDEDHSVESNNLKLKTIDNSDLDENIIWGVYVSSITKNAKSTTINNYEETKGFLKQNSQIFDVPTFTIGGAGEMYYDWMSDSNLNNFYKKQMEKIINSSGLNSEKNIIMISKKEDK